MSVKVQTTFLFDNDIKTKFVDLAFKQKKSMAALLNQLAANYVENAEKIGGSLKMSSSVSGPTMSEPKKVDAHEK